MLKKIIGALNMSNEKSSNSNGESEVNERTEIPDLSIGIQAALSNFISEKFVNRNGELTADMLTEAYQFDTSRFGSEDHEKVRLLETERRVYLKAKNILELTGELDEDCYWDLRTEAEEAVSDLYTGWILQNSMQQSGFAVSGFVKEDAANPLFAPIHGINLYDYTAMCIKLSGGTPKATVLKAMGLDAPVWEEINSGWTDRMSHDTSFSISAVFGQYYGEPAAHPKLENLQSDFIINAENIQRIKDDLYFYLELEAARTAAYQYGLDGGKWIIDNYGIPLAEFQSAAIEHMENRNKNFNSRSINEQQQYSDTKLKEYTERFAKEMGGNVADDIDF
jgi:hypothetical protein